MNKICTKCKADIAADSLFCPKCGEQLAESANTVSCSICGEVNSIDSKACSNCGVAISSNFQVVSNSENSSRPVVKTNKKINSAVNKANKQNSVNLSSAKKDLSNQTMGLIFVGLLVVGIIIIVSSGVLNEPTHQVNGKTSAMEEASGTSRLESQSVIDTLKKLVAANPESDSIRLQLAYSLHDANRIEEAIPVYKEYLKNNSSNVNVIVDLGICYEFLKNSAEASALFKDALSKDPNHVMAMLYSGISAKSLNKLEVANSWFKKVIEIAPGSKEAEQAKKIMQ